MKKTLSRTKLVLMRETVGTLRADHLKKVIGGIETNPNIPDSDHDSCTLMKVDVHGR